MESESVRTGQLPNGSHEAGLRELNVDFAVQQVRHAFQFWVCLLKTSSARNQLSRIVSRG
jgi:hypothetical protein